MKCQWFALCTNEATGTMPHPILDDVPVCDRCREWYDYQGLSTEGMRAYDEAIRCGATHADAMEAGHTEGYTK